MLLTGTFDGTHGISLSSVLKECFPVELLRRCNAYGPANLPKGG